MKQVYAIAGVSKQSHHKFESNKEEYTSQTRTLIHQVDQIRKSHPGCGLEKVYWVLRPQGIGRDKFISLFQGLGYGLVRKKNQHRTTIPTHIRFPNLITGMKLDGSDQLWQSDITYFYVKNRYYYLTFIIDVYTKEIKGYAVSDHMRAEANIKALKMAFKNASTDLRGMIHHSDRGSQYVDKEYQKLLTQQGIYISMGLIAQDNAYAERINGTIKNEYLIYRTLNGYADLKKQVKKEVNHYNRKRPHNHLPKRSPPSEFAKRLLNLNNQERPTVIVYAEGNYTAKEVSILHNSKPRTRPIIHGCPIVNS